MAEIEIPMDIITTSILPKLPPKSLARFKCVSKSWNSLLKTPDFIALHLTHSLSSNNRLLILNFKTHLQSTPFTLLGSHFDDNINPTSRFDIPTSYSGREREVAIIGSCNGLVALVCYYIDNPLLDFIIWNPSTNFHFLLPHNYHYAFKDIKDDGGITGVTFGFGYDCCNDDYIIVLLADFFNPSSDDDNDDDDDHGDCDCDGDGADHVCKRGLIFRQVWVYNMVENRWRIIQVRFTGDRIEWDSDSAVINNHLLHWIFWNYMEKVPNLRVFDIATFDWTRLSLPNIRGNNNNGDDEGEKEGFEMDDFVGLGDLGGCLCLVTRVCPELDNAYVWVMKEYGVTESWTVLFNVVDAGVVGPLLGAPIGCSKEGDEVLVRKANEDGGGGLWVYDMRKKSVKDAGVKISSDLKLHGVNICVESLVPVPKMVDGKRCSSGRGDHDD